MINMKQITKTVYSPGDILEVKNGDILVGYYLLAIVPYNNNCFGVIMLTATREHKDSIGFSLFHESYQCANIQEIEEHELNLLFRSGYTYRYVNSLENIGDDLNKLILGNKLTTKDDKKNSKLKIINL